MKIIEIKKKLAEWKKTKSIELAWEILNILCEDFNIKEK